MALSRVGAGAARYVHSGSERLIRGRLREPRSADAAWRAAQSTSAAPRGAFQFDAFEVPTDDIDSRQRLFEETKQSAIEYLETNLAQLDPDTPEHAAVAQELDELRRRDAPLGVLLARPQGGGQLQEGDVIKVRVVEMERSTRFIKCSRVYPRKAVLRVLHGPHVEESVSAAALGSTASPPKWVSATNPANPLAAG